MNCSFTPSIEYNVTPITETQEKVETPTVQEILQQWADAIKANSEIRSECLRENDELRKKAHQSYLLALKEIDARELQIVNSANEYLNKLTEQYMNAIAEVTN